MTGLFSVRYYGIKNNMSKLEHKKHYDESGKLEYEVWRLNGKLHRTDGPAHIGYYESGELRCEAWWLNGKHHRTDGPAFISHHKNGKLRY